MKVFISGAFLLLYFSLSVQAQDCEAFILTESGKTAEFVDKDKKGKPESYHSQKLISVTEQDGTTEYRILRISKDKKQKEVSRDTMIFSCADGVFYVDMDAYVDDGQTEAYEESQISFEFENIGYPANMSVGSTLDDGSVTFTVDMGMMTISNETRIINRKVEARENVTTPAGTFDCYKISQEIQNKMGFVTVKLKSVSWLTKGIGAVKSISYDADGEVLSTSELVSLK